MNPLLIILIIISVLFSLFLFIPIISGYKARGKETTHLSGVVPDSVRNHHRYLLYFWAPACGMCRGMTPILESLVGERDDVAVIDASKHPESARALGVLGTPALVLVEKGFIKKVILGAKSKTAIVEILESQ